MTKAYSNDLRERVIKKYLDGMSKEDIVNIFVIGLDTLNRWIRKYKKTGNVEPEKQTKFRERKFSDEEILDAVRSKSSLRLKEIAKKFSFTHQAVSDRLKLAGVTQKKTFLYQERNEEKRQEFIAKIKFEDFSKIVYIDESGLKNSMTDEYGWSLRGTPVCGEKKEERQKD
uniref:IS630 transposase-related protein n=1 Tax=Candidatus Electronema sp. TaxID=2698783 RepID=UPI0040576FB4